METRSDRAGWIVHRERQNEINSIDLTRNYLNDFSGDGISGSKPLEVRVETGASRCAGEMQRWIREGPRRREPLSVAGTRLVYFKRNFGEEREKEMRERCHLELQMPDRGNKEGCPSRISEERQSKSYRSKVLRGKWIDLSVALCQSRLYHEDHCPVRRTRRILLFVSIIIFRKSSGWIQSDPRHIEPREFSYQGSRVSRVTRTVLQVL